MKPTFILRPLVAAILAGSAMSSYAVSFTNGDVTLDINGTVNGFYVNREVKATDATGKDLATVTNSSIGNGLLPGWINFVATTKVDGNDVKAHISFAPGINNNSNTVGLPIGNPGAGNSSTNAYSQIDTRNVFFQYGNNDTWGTVKVGRDIGLFGQNIILSDMTLLGVGGTTAANIPFNTTFGMIGHGYMYTGFQPQITYTTPYKDGWQASIGIFQPSKFAGDQTKTPGVQAMASYDWKGSMPGKVWVGSISQNTSCSGNTANCVAYNAQGQEIGVKATSGKFEGVLYAFSGKGLGLSTIGAQFLGGADATTGDRTDSKGYFAQLTYKLDGKNKVGVNYGKNKDSEGAVGVGNSTTNQAYTLGWYHSLNKYVTLVAEWNQEKSQNSYDAATSKTRNISLGGILFF